MHLKSLLLRNFRNYREEEIFFSPKENLFYGDNAQGKTNLLEALFLLATGKSFRTAGLKELIGKYAPFFHVQAFFEKQGVSESIQITFSISEKKILYNQTRYPSFTHLLGIFPLVLYSPLDIQLIEGPPLFRRRFLNLLLAQIDPLYVHHFFRFHKSLKTRNFLLRKGSSSSLFLWEKQMASSASYLMQKRAQLILSFKHSLRKCLSDFSFPYEQFVLEYKPSFPLTEENLELFYLEILEKNRKKEFLMKSTQSGPHKDELFFGFDEGSAKTFASEGQKKSFLFLLKLLQWHFLSEQTGEKVPFAIDDFDAHFDCKRKDFFAKTLSRLSQVIVTNPFAPKSTSWFCQEIVSGKIKQASNPSPKL